ncbi:MAG: flagellin [Planctomycetes bacterium]|nr:flagellin [Planctomycetota bacterium]
MALTVTNINTLSLLNILNRTSAAQSNTLTRLSTGLRINRGADDPAGLIALRSVEGELTSVDAAITSNQRTDAILGVADGALTEVASLLTEIRSLASASANSAGLTAAELSANQAQIDNAIESIDRIIGTTSFNCKKLLDGSLGINVSGVAGANISDVQVFNRSSSSSSSTISVEVTAAAEKGLLSSYATTSASTATSISVQGKLGTAIIDISAGENLSSVAANINAATAQTGVVASAASGNDALHLTSQDYGTNAFVRVTAISGDTTNYTSSNDSGADASVTVNGQTAAVDGLEVNFSSNGVSLAFNLTTTYNQATGSTSFTVTDGGATFQLGTETSTRSTIGIDGLYSQQLGSASAGYLMSLKSGGTNSLLNDPGQAAAIAEAAASKVAKVSGRIGGFQKFQVQTALRSMNSTKTGLETARSVIGDADYATETAALNRQNVLLQSAISLLGLANQQSAQVLSLLR